MSLLSKFRMGPASEPVSRPLPARDRAAMQPLHESAARTAPALHPGRFSNGLKEFLWHLDGIGRGQLLDLGPVSQSTVSFFIERGYKVHTEDVLSSWRAFGRAEDDQLRLLPEKAEPLDMSAGARADRFLISNLNHAPDSLDAVLLWDLLEYLEKDVVSRVVARISSLVRDGGAILALFHQRIPEAFHRYRVLDAHNLELVPATGVVQPQHVYQNREIQELLRRFRSSKTFVGRDQLREGVFVK